jgi:hypothetical protein
VAVVGVAAGLSRCPSRVAAPGKWLALRVPARFGCRLGIGKRPAQKAPGS